MYVATRPLTQLRFVIEVSFGFRITKNQGSAVPWCVW
jgi:hypothetical protein